MTPKEIKKFGEEILIASKAVELFRNEKVRPKLDNKLKATRAKYCPLGALLRMKYDHHVFTRPSAMHCEDYLPITKSEARGFIQGFENPGEFDTNGDILFYNLGRHFRKLALNGWNEKN